MDADPRWLAWARRLQSVSQNGLTFSQDPFDRERYEAVREVAAEMLTAGSGLELAAVRGLLERETGYLTPKVDVRGVVFREPDGRLLLVRERLDGDRWTLPGGWADPGDSPGECAVRETREESGYETRAVKIIAVLDRARHPYRPTMLASVFKLYVCCELLGGAATESHETSGAAFFAEDELPAAAELSLGRVTPASLARCFAHRRDPARPTDFD